MAKSKDKSKPKPKPPAEPKAEAKEKPSSKSSARGAGKVGAGSYWERTKLPVYGLAFVLPMVLFYEVCIVIVNQPSVATTGKALRISSDSLIREVGSAVLSWVGLGRFFMSGILVVVVLLIWQFASRKSWQVQIGTLLGMLGEALAWAAVPVLVTFFIVDPLLKKLTIENDTLPWLYSHFFRDIVCGFGAGVYEEFIFRLLLGWVLGTIVMGLTKLSWERSVLVAVLLASVPFALAHYTGFGGMETFQWTSMISRTCLGAFLGVVYYFRGFGVAVGTHAMFNILLTVLTAIHLHQGAA